MVQLVPIFLCFSFGCKIKALKDCKNVEIVQNLRKFETISAAYFHATVTSMAVTGQKKNWAKLISSYFITKALTLSNH